MKINIEHSGIKLEITYNKKGYLDYVKDISNNKYMMIESKIKGIGYEITKDPFIIDNNTIYVCDARYVRIMDIDLFIPRLIFIPNQM